LWLPLHPAQSSTTPQALGAQGDVGGGLQARPKDIFRKHFVVAPFPEENVEAGCR